MRLRIGGAPGPDVPQNPAVPARKILGAQGRHRSGAHLGNRRGIQEGNRHARPRVEQVQQGHLGWQTPGVFVHVIPDNLHPGQAQRAHIAPEDVEVPI